MGNRHSQHQQEGPPPPYGIHQPHNGPYMTRTSQTFRNNGDLYGQAYNRPLYPQTLAPNLGARPTPPAAPTNAAQAADKQLSPTQTIRNPINVKKNSVQLVPVPGQPHKLAVSFSFDASHPCALSVFVMAKENTEDGCGLQPSRQPAERQHFYTKGLNLRYPQPGKVGVVVDTSLYSEEDLRVESVLAYPLVIRGEAITDTAAEEGHTLEELNAGGPQKVWMQSQTTYAKLVKDESGKWQVVVLKQKIWAMGTSYELQEIYGMEHAAAAAKERTGIASARAAQESEDERMCVICLSIERDTTVLPCRHMCMCHECAQELRKQTSKCPICRNHVESLLHIRMSRQQVPKSVQTPVDQSTVTAALQKMGLGNKKTEQIQTTRPPGITT